MGKTTKSANDGSTKGESPIVWIGNEDLRPLLVPIGSLKLDPANARRHPERNQQSIRKSLQRFGQQKPIVVDSRGIVRAGNGTLEQAMALGWTHVARTRSELSDAELKAYAIADNVAGDFAEWDPDVLRDQLEELDDADFDLDAAGLALSEEDLDELIGDQRDDDSEGSSAESSGKADGGGAAGAGAVREQWKILIRCASEAEQVKLLERFDRMGLDCRALIG